MKLPPWIRGLIDLFSTGKRTGIALGVLGVVVILISTLSSFVSHVNNPEYYGELVTPNAWLYVGLIIIVLAILAFIGDIRYSAMQQREQEIKGQERLRSAEDKLAESLKNAPTTDKENVSLSVHGQPSADDALALSVLWEVTNARLSQYHGIATGQARKSFATAQTAIAVGFLLLIGFAILSFRTHSTTASITTAALGAVAAALTGYISHTFVRSQETSARHLRAYFDQPLEFSRYLAAERLLSSQPGTKPEERDAILRIIIRAMVENTDTDSTLESDLWENGLIRSMRDFVKSRDQPNEANGGPSALSTGITGHSRP